MTKRDTSNEETEVWRAYRDEKQRRAGARREAGTAAILRLRDEGYAVEALTDCQFRVNGQLDLFPTNGKFHYLPTNVRGRYRSPIGIVQRWRLKLRVIA